MTLATKSSRAWVNSSLSQTTNRNNIRSMVYGILQQKSLNKYVLNISYHVSLQFNTTVALVNAILVIR